ncbi:nucleosome/chromatin assembly factor group C5 [Artemisia annua]|uniref:Nucleosome/chromatin assembly factor group C5 n=1 Tax=Artemisia annua TaxID=35608 RepID=A0A2U1LIX5_ARTAN|nr:nucleosome/chromatin assembly factor group C5 [Artemisia annua]
MFRDGVRCQFSMTLLPLFVAEYHDWIMLTLLICSLRNSCSIWLLLSTLDCVSGWASLFDRIMGLSLRAFVLGCPGLGRLGKCFILPSLSALAYDFTRYVFEICSKYMVCWTKWVDFHWNVYDPWTIVSVSDDVETTSGGGTLQIWRMSDLIYRPRNEVLTELEDFKAHVAGCSPKA